MKEKNKGITLIALIITIIVMLILVGVSVSILINSNLIGAAEKTATAYDEARRKEANSEGITINGKTINEYMSIDWEAAKAKATSKHPAQQNTEDIGIGTDGELVNLDLWKYSYNKNKEAKLSLKPDAMKTTGYIGNFPNGKIVGTVPAYIKKAGDENFLPVTAMTETFRGCTGLTTAPTIPSSVTNMDGTFDGCTSLTTAPEIPSSVTGMGRTFRGCTSLTTAPEIPSSVKGMTRTFSGCTSLTTAPEIPSSVEDMFGTFDGCTSLTTAPEIPSSVTDLTLCFANCTSLTIAPELWKRVTTDTTTYKGTPVGNGCFEGCTSASNINEIPEYWKTFHEKEIIHVIPKKK